MKTKPQLILISCFFLFTPATKGQDTINVPLDYLTIQLALDAAEANTVILVEPGTYYENLEWPRFIYGIQLKGQKGKDSTIIDANQLGRGITKNSFADDPGSLIEGFTIRNGKINEVGGGIYIDGRGTTLRNLIIADNTTTIFYGGGAHLSQYSGLIDSCLFSGNRVSLSGGAYGGGLSVTLDGPVEIRNSLFTLNSAYGINGSLGGGLYTSNGDGHDLLIHKCTFKENMAHSNFNANCRGGAMYVSGKFIVIDSCIIEDNWTQDENISEGGGIYSKMTNFTLKNSILSNNESNTAFAIMFDADEKCTNTILNTIIQGHRKDNQATTSIIEDRSPASTLDIRNTLIVNNRGRPVKIDHDVVWPKYQLRMNHCTVAGNWTGGIELRNTHATISNSILWNASESFVLTDSNEMDINYNIILGGFEGTSNIDSNPMFENTFTFPLSDGSPALSAGNPWLAESFDIYGNPRPLPINTLPDLGAVETKQSLAFVHLKFYYDINENGIRDTLERFAQIGAVSVNNDKTYTNFRQEGLVIALDTGALSIEYDDAFHSDWKVTSDPLYTNHIDENAFFEVVEFGIAPVSGEVKANIYITSDPFRCSQSINMSVTIANENSYIDTSVLWLRLDERVENYAFQVPFDTMLDPNTIGWVIPELFPSETFTIDGSIASPGIGGNTLPGDTLKIETWIAGFEEDLKFAYEGVLLCSYDPNDKLVNPNRQDSLALIDAPLFYTIRFQNTGNDYAKHVSIIDTLDPFLDLSTFRLIHTSHTDHLEVIFQGGNVVTFSFENIFLPDSTSNFEASNGHVAFSIRALSDVERKSRIENTARIYFDFNPAVITNTTSSIMVDDYTVTSLAVLPHYENVAYPSPATGTVYLMSPAEEVQVFDMNGMLLEKYYNVHEFEVHHLCPGLYLLSLLNKGQYVIQKIVMLGD